MSTRILEELKKAVRQYDAEEAVRWAKEAIRVEIDPVEIADTLTRVVREIGEGYSQGDLFLPDLVGAAEAMQKTMPIIQEEIKRMGKVQPTLGTVVLATVYGDIHSIGKTMVSTLLIAGGFKVHDLGVNIAAEIFIEAVSKYKADIIAMSALMTTTAPEQEKVIKILAKKGLREKVKVMVGGGAMTEEFATEIGADGYGATASEAVNVAERLIG